MGCEGRLEMGDLTDPVAGEGDHENAALRCRRPVTGSRTYSPHAGWPFARTGTIRAIRAGGAASMRGEEAMHGLGAAVLERQGRHPHPRVIGHQRDERVDVAAR